MAASADKVQYILEALLEDSLPLVRKGLFSQDQLRTMMARRQQHEQAMLSSHHQLTDYLAAIEYQYQLQRQRRSRMDQHNPSSGTYINIQEGTQMLKQEGTDSNRQGNPSKSAANPLFRKQSSADFAIVKRILRLWDRTMQKYRFKIHLWRQYLRLCVVLGSKKHFYKVLTNAIRFLPFQVELWKIGVAYEKEVGLNPWKARKLLIKGLRMVPVGLRNVELGEFMLMFQVEFIRTLLQRQQILVKGEQPMKFVGQAPGQAEQQQESEQEKGRQQQLNLQSYDSVLSLVVEQIVSKNSNQHIHSLSLHSLKQRMLSVVKQLIANEEEQVIVSILTKTQQKIVQMTAPKGKHQQTQHNQQQSQQKIVQMTAPKGKHQQTQHNQQQLQIEEEQQLQAEQELQIQQQESVYMKKMSVQQLSKIADPQQRLSATKHLILTNQHTIDWTITQKVVKSFCLKPLLMADVYSFLYEHDPTGTINHLSNQKMKLPTPLLLQLLHDHQQGLISTIGDTEQKESVGSNQQIVGLLIEQIDKRVQPREYYEDIQLLRAVIKFNANNGRHDSTVRIMRSLAVAYRKEGDFLEQCNRVASSA